MNKDKRVAIINSNNEATSNTRTSVLTIDSGWDKDRPEAHRVILEFQTTRGQSVRMNKETFEKKLAAEIESKRKPTPKINDKFRFDDGTIGTIIGVTETTIEINVGMYCGEPMLKAIPIADLTFYRAPVTSNAIWTVKG